MSEKVNDRKIQHLEIVNSDAESDRQQSYFDYVQLKHRALPQLNLADVDTAISFLGKHLSFPLLISSMTGGDHDLVRKINFNLAAAAEKTQVAMAVGSQRVMFNNPGAQESFALRKYAPSTVLLANLGAVQLNYGFGLEQCREAIAVLGADALCLHLNALQECVQPEGDTNFSDLSDKIIKVAQALEKPIILKEVGCGFSAEDVELVIKHGINYIDVAGAGGTSWSRIEHHRRVGISDHNSLGITFQDWGIPTPLSLELLKPYRESVTLIASGGLRSGIDMAKAIVLGASLCGIAAPFLKAAMTSSDSVVNEIEKLRKEFLTAMFLLGVDSVEKLRGNAALVAYNEFSI